MITEKTFHYSIGLPSNFTRPEHLVRLAYTLHARKRAAFKFGNELRLPGALNLSKFQVIEVTMTGNKVSKLVVRGAYTEKRDIVFVIVPRRDKWLCVTVWPNDKCDIHKTLDRSKYSIPD